MLAMLLRSIGLASAFRRSFHDVRELLQGPMRVPSIVEESVILGAQTSEAQSGDFTALRPYVSVHVQEPWDRRSR